MSSVTEYLNHFDEDGRYVEKDVGVPGTPYLTAWANSGKSGRASREQALRRMAIRQARLEPLALSASGHGRMVNGWAAAG